MVSYSLLCGGTPDGAAGVRTIGQVIDAQFGVTVGLFHRTAEAGWTVTTAQPASVPIAVTFSSGGTPDVYTTPTGALTVADSTIPTVVELLAYCNELRGNVRQLQAILTAYGLTY